MSINSVAGIVSAIGRGLACLQQQLPRSTTLRQRLLVAFTCSAAAATLSGFVGVYYVHRISANVTHVSEVTSPLLTETMSLIDAAQRARSAVLLAVEKDPMHAPEQLAALHSEMHARIEGIKTLASRANIDLQSNSIERRERRFAEAAKSIIDASQRRREAAALVNKSLARLTELTQALRSSSASLAALAEGEMTRGEEDAKTSVQTGEATIVALGNSFSRVMTEIYPVVQGANKLLRELDQANDAVQLMVARSNQVGPIADNDDSDQIFQTMDTVTKKIGGRIASTGGQAAFKAIRSNIAELRSLVSEIRTHQLVVVSATAEIDTASRVLEAIQNEYFGVLADVDSAVRRLDQGAQLATARELERARDVVTAVALLTLLAGCAFSILVTRRLGGPLARLTEQVKRIRESGELTPLPMRPTDQRLDEVGALAQSFNLMISELAEARSRLIAWSAAEIKTQYDRLNLAINSIPQGLCMFDSEQKLIVCNTRYQEMYELPPEHTVPGVHLSTILSYREANDNVSSECPKRLYPAIAAGRPWQYIDELRSGKTVAISYLPLSTGGSISTHEDITLRREAEEQIAHMALYDALTDLPNRVLFRKQMEQALERGEESSVAVFCLDLDQFKNVNDSLGHPVGDELLKSVAERLRECLRPTDCVARLGGDEFAIVQADVDQPAAASALAERLIEVLSEPFSLQGHRVIVGASVGISLAPRDGLDPDRLLKNADMALYLAKADGRGVYRFFTPEMDVRMQMRRVLEMDLRNATERLEFELHYQPLINLVTDRVSAFEALLRWRHPKRGLVPPNDFIPLAEEIGLINRIGRWALQQACTEAMHWPSDISVAVNLSPAQFKSRTLVLDVISALGASGLPAHRLELEITETVLLNDTEATISTLNQLRDLGVQIAMDDFGTGYSSLGYLRKFPFDKIKIDQSFIQDLPQSPDSIAIVRAVASLGQALGISTTAEGVETEAQLRHLKEEKCTEAQGFLLGKPQTASDLATVFRAGNWHRLVADG